MSLVHKILGILSSCM